MARNATESDFRTSKMVNIYIYAHNSSLFHGVEWVVPMLKDCGNWFNHCLLIKISP